MNEQTNIENKIKESKKKFFFSLLVLVISVIMLYVIVMLLFQNGRINQGKFRTADVILTSYAKFEDKSMETGKWTYNISQSNKLSLLINSSATDSITAYITDIVATKPNIYLSQEGFEENVAKANNDEIFYLTSQNNNNNFLYEIIVTNKNVLDMYEIPSNVTEITHDASIFGIANMTLENLKFNIKFKLNIQEKNGKTNVMEIELNLPQNDITKEGNIVTRLSKDKYIFKFK